MSIKYRSFDGERVSAAWSALLRDVREIDDVRFHVNEGHRTMARQQELFEQNMRRVNGRWVPRPGHPLTAFPKRTAPHIRTGRSDHALDVVSSKGAPGGTPLAFVRACRKRGVNVSFPVPGEAWHVEADRSDLLRYWKNRRALRRPASARRVSGAGIALIARFEGLRLYVYADAAGHATVGYGHLLHFGAPTALDRKRYGTKDDPRMTQDEAASLLRQDIHVKAADHVRELVKVSVTQNEFDALASLVFNIGPGAFSGSTVLRELNKGHRRRAGLAFLLWNKAGGKVLLGLSRRRHAERRLFRRPAA